MVDEGAGRILSPAGTAIGAVGIPGECCDSRRTRKRDCERQRVFLIWPTAALSAQRDRELAPGKHHGPAPLCLEIAGKARMGGRDDAGLAFDIGTEHNGLVS